MRIAFATDLHLPPVGTIIDEIDTRQNFQRLLDILREDYVDGIIIGGDLSWKDPDIEVNRFVFDELKKLGIPFHCIPGNHDDNDHLSRHFYNKKASELYPSVVEFKSVKCLLIDSSQKTIGEDQLLRAQDILQQGADINMIFIHHPVLEVNVPYMERYHSLQGRDRIMELLTTIDRPLHIFTGHYHVERTSQYKNLIQYVTPSLYVQIADRSEEFEVDHKIPGYRIIEVNDHTVITQVRYY